MSAKIDLKFIDSAYDDDFIKVESIESLVLIDGCCNHHGFSIVLDKSTAIKFAKTLRTEINKIQD